MRATAAPAAGRRVTITDVARRADVSTAAVSYALNGQTGVSTGTRARILAVAEELGFRPHSAARALSGARSGAVGLTQLSATPSTPPGVLGDPAAAQPSYLDALGSGFRSALGPAEYALLQRVIPGDAAANLVHRQWWAERRVDGFVITNVTVDDPRVGVLVELGAPAVAVADPRAAPGLACAWSDDEGALTEVVAYLVALAHRRIVWVGGLPTLFHSRIRAETMQTAGRRFGLELAETVDAGWSAASATRATRALLSRRDRPTAVIYDSDVMAVGGLAVAAEMGIDVPGELSLVSFEDSPLLALVQPSVTALSRDIHGYGELAARMLLAQIAGEPVPDGGLMAQSVLVPRGSTRALDAARSRRSRPQNPSPTPKSRRTGA